MSHKFSMIGCILISLTMALSAFGKDVSAEKEKPRPFIEYITLASQELAHRNLYPTIDLLEDGTLFCVWTVMERVGEKNINIVGAFSVDHGKTWSRPVNIIKSPDMDFDPSTVVAGKRIIVTSTTRPPTNKMSTSITLATRSEDSGRTWSELYQISMNHRYTCGKIHRALQIRNGWLLMPYSWDRILETGSEMTSEGQMDMAIGMMISKDNGLTWFNSADAYAKTKKGKDGAIDGVDEPAIVELNDGTIYTLLRTGNDYLWESRSRDNGLTWDVPTPSPLFGRNAPAALHKITGDRGEIVVIWNKSKVRNPLCAALSNDNCKSWSQPRVLIDTGGPRACYPGCVQAADGTIVVVWEQQHDQGQGHDIRLARFNRAWLTMETKD